MTVSYAQREGVVLEATVESGELFSANAVVDAADSAVFNYALDAVDQSGLGAVTFEPDCLVVFINPYDAGAIRHFEFKRV